MAYQVTLSNAKKTLAEVVACVDAHAVSRVELGSRGSAMDPWETDCRNWASSGLGKKLHPVDSSTAEYEAICERFYATVDEGTYEISWIHRVENLPLHNAFRMACENKTTTDIDFDPEEGVRWLFHGTRTYKALNSIVNCTSTGFHTLLTGSVTGNLHGKGVYFAKDGNYTSLRYTSPAHDADGTRLHGYSQIIVANVIVGKFKKGPDVRVGGAEAEAEARQLPLLPGDPFRRYDSFVDDVGDPKLFVVQNPAHTYPAYVITFRGEPWRS